MGINVLTLALTKQYVKENISSTFKPEVVNSLPISGKEGVLYLVPNKEGGTYKEYLWVNKKWEQIGDSSVLPDNLLTEENKAVPNGLATLNAEGKLALEQKPTYTAQEVKAVPEGTFIPTKEAFDKKVNQVEGSRLITTPEVEKIARLKELNPIEKNKTMTSPVGFEKETGKLFANTNNKISVKPKSQVSTVQNESSMVKTMHLSTVPAKQKNETKVERRYITAKAIELYEKAHFAQPVLFSTIDNANSPIANNSSDKNETGQVELNTTYEEIISYLDEGIEVVLDLPFIGILTLISDTRGVDGNINTNFSQLVFGRLAQNYSISSEKPVNLISNLEIIIEPNKPISKIYEYPHHTNSIRYIPIENEIIPVSEQQINNLIEFDNVLPCLTENNNSFIYYFLSYDHKVPEDLKSSYVAKFYRTKEVAGSVVTEILTVENSKITRQSFSGGGSSGGSSGLYETLPDKPKINNIVLQGNKTTKDLLLNYNDLSEHPSINGIPLKGNLTTEDLNISSERPTFIVESIIDIDNSHINELTASFMFIAAPKVGIQDIIDAKAAQNVILRMYLGDKDHNNYYDISLVESNINECCFCGTVRFASNISINIEVTGQKNSMTEAVDWTIQGMMRSYCSLNLKLSQADTVEIIDPEKFDQTFFLHLMFGGPHTIYASILVITSDGIERDTLFVESISAEGALFLNNTYKKLFIKVYQKQVSEDPNYPTYKWVAEKIQ